jgi:nitrogen fixation protein FixH
MTSVVEKPGFRLTGGHVLAAVVGFFAIVIAVDVTFAIIAYRTFPGEVSVTPYEDGILYNRTLAQEAAQARLGWRAGARGVADGVEVVFQDKDGAPLTGLKLTGKLERPATEAGRVVPRFVETAPGRYLAPARLHGAWDLTVEARDARGHLFIAQRRLAWT